MPCPKCKRWMKISGYPKQTKNRVTYQWVCKCGAKKTTWEEK